MSVLYSIYEISDENGGLGSCICEEYNRKDAINKASTYFCDQAIESADFGDGEIVTALVSFDNVTNEEKMSNQSVEWFAEEPDNYDGGREDFANSRI